MHMSVRLLSSSWLPLLVAFAIAACRPAPDTTHVEKVGPGYRVDAAGTRASEAARWTIRFSPEDRVGLLTGCARCGTTAYLMDVQEATVHRADLRAGKLIGRIGRPNDLVEPRAIAADCDGGRLYVVDYRTVVVFRMSDGAAIRTYKLPEGVSVRGRLVARTADGGELGIPALWEPSRDFSSTYPQDALFRGARVGLRLSLADGVSTPVAHPMGLGCRGYAQGCWQTSLGVAETQAGRQWVVTQGLLPTLAVLDAQTTHRRSFDVASNLFKDDGRSLARGADRDAQTDWSARNSKIDAAIPFGDTIAVVHSYVSSWTPGGPAATRHAVFLNLVSLAGEALVCDLALPGAPVGFDADRLYVLDFGESAQGTERESVDLVSFEPATLLGGTTNARR